MDEKAPPLSPIHIQKPVQLEIPANLPLTYSDVAHLQETPNSVRILFFQSMPPVVQSKEAAEAIESVRAVCVAQIVAPVSLMDRLAQMWHARKRPETTK